MVDEQVCDEKDPPSSQMDGIRCAARCTAIARSEGGPGLRRRALVGAVDRGRWRRSGILPLMAAVYSQSVILGPHGRSRRRLRRKLCVLNSVHPYLPRWSSAQREMRAPQPKDQWTADDK